MSRYRAALDRERAHIVTLRVIAGLLALMLLGAGLAWDRARQALTLYYPPDLRSGATLKAGEVPPASVYAFAYYIFQQLNRWPHSGEQDYPRAIYRLASYMTPAMEQEVLADLKYKGKGGELSYRTRAVQESPGTGYEEARVEVLGNGVWVVHLTLQIIESVQGMKVKDTTVSFPLRVVRYPIDPERNPWGLALDGYARAPVRLATETPPESLPAALTGLP